ncbi:MAG: transcriptional regulator [Desulfurococcales archaeon]|jgi:predicted DNA-binding transcriptional regulator|nr:transcriptional regulator [Desulfurococcales archaeon]
MPERDKLIGVGLMAISAVVILIYLYGLFFSTQAIAEILVKLTVFVAVAGVMGILGWIGYTLATTPPPKPIEEIEKEIEAELKKLEEQAKSEKEGEIK